MSEKSKNSGCIGGVIFGAVIVPFFGIFAAWGLMGTQSFIAGDESAFNPINEFVHAQGLAEDGQFYRMTATYVMNNGTLDLTADYEPTVVYEFTGGEVDDGTPIGAGGKKTQFIRVRVTEFGFEQTGSVGNETYYDLNLGMRKSEYAWESLKDIRPTEPPKCQLVEFWDHATTKGAPVDAVAIITYDADGYHFSIDKTEYSYRFGKDCQVVGG